jgi:hypothetical protein
MLYLKTTGVVKAPGVYEVDVAAKPPGKTFGVYLATDPDNAPDALLAALAAEGYEMVHQQAYTHKDKGRVLDLHFQKHGSDLFKGWTVDECGRNLAALDLLFGSHGIVVTPRVMSLAEAYA